jgi:hypothetical protein
MRGEKETSQDISSALIQQAGRGGAPKKGAWKFNFFAYAAGLLFLLVAGVLFVVKGLPTIRDDSVVIQFSLAAPEAHSVALVGDFNEWDKMKTPLKKSAEGIWQISIRLKKGMVYTYNFVINGEEFVTDPTALINVDDGFGGESSLLKL